MQLCGAGGSPAPQPQVCPFSTRVIYFSYSTGSKEQARWAQ